MKEIGVRELRQNASKYLSAVDAGETFAVTVRGRVVARLVPVSDGERTRERLINQGALTPARLGGFTPPDLSSLPEHDLSAILEQLREDR